MVKTLETLETVNKTDTKEKVARNYVPKDNFSMSVHDTYTFLHEGNMHVSYGSRIFLKKVDFDIIVCTKLKLSRKETYYCEP